MVVQELVEQEGEEQLLANRFPLGVLRMFWTDWQWSYNTMLTLKAIRKMAKGKSLVMPFFKGESKTGW